MYIENNNYNVFQENFTFAISKGISKVNIDCTDGAVLYPLSDVAQGIACVGPGETVEVEFELYENTDLILENYLNTGSISFGTFTLEEITADNTDLFSSRDTMQEFYIAQGVLIICMLLIIFINKFTNLGRN